jgi:hypothetical protein
MERLVKPESGGGTAKEWQGALSTALAVAVLLVATLAMFGDVLVARDDRVLAQYGTDLSYYFASLRSFAFRELQQGNFPLWNPHAFSGHPFFGNFESAMLYPFNAIFLLFPLHRAINISIALHVFLIGLFMFMWARSRGIGTVPSTFAGLLTMFSGTHFLHIYAGHLSDCTTMTWVPLLFMAIDRVFERRTLPYVLLGAFATAMMILAGHVQYVFFAAVVAAIYVGFRIIPGPKRAIVVGLLVAMCLLALGMVAVQVLVGLEAGEEGGRQSGLPFEMAAEGAFPPENLITYLVPGLFGDMVHGVYWGRYLLWEVSLFIGLVGFALALYGAFVAPKRSRVILGALIIVLFVLALGVRTPLFTLLYHWVPGFNLFRGFSKFVIFMNFFVVLLAAYGLERLLADGRHAPRLAVAAGSAAVLLGFGALLVYSAAGKAPDAGWWRELMLLVKSARESFTPWTSEYMPAAGRFAALSLAIAAGTSALAALLFYFRSGRVAAAHALIALAVIEVFAFAWMSRVTFPLSKLHSAEVEQVYAMNPGDYRVLFSPVHAHAELVGKYDIWGFHIPLGRYSEFIAFTQGVKPDEATERLMIKSMHPLFDMLRCRFFIQRTPDGLQIFQSPTTLPRSLLISDVRVIPNRDEQFAAMGAPGFDPRKTVLLEKEPQPSPIPSANPGTIRIVDESTDHLTIEAVLASPAILVVTDPYSNGWRARALPGSAQKDYEVMPANYVLRGIPLAQGRHRIRLEYMPRTFIPGLWITVISWLLFAAATVFCALRGQGTPQAVPAEEPS